MLTTLATVKARLGIEDADVKDDALLLNFILLVSARFENECNRTFGYGKNVIEEFQADETEIRPEYFPIDETQAISFQYRETVAAGWLTPTVMDYIVRRGSVISLSGQIATWKAQAKVTYSGGYKLPDGTSDVLATVPLPDDLQFAAIEQLAYLHQNRARLGMTSVTGVKGSIQQLTTLDLLPSVMATVKKFERVMA